MTNEKEEKVIYEWNDDNIEIKISGNSEHNNKSRGNLLKFTKKLNQVTPLIALVVFLLLGFLKNAWHPGWLVFLSIPFVGIITSAMVNKKRATVISMLIAIIGYLVLGFVFNAWHPGWIIFFIIPISEILFK